MDIIVPLDNERYEEYINRILSSRENIKDIENYQEKHHIKPKCLGGNDSKDNLIFLYAQEHYCAHKILAKENPTIKGLQLAWWNMCQAKKEGRIYKISKEEYSNAREKAGKIMSDYMHENRGGANNPNFGKHFSEEHKRKMSDARKGIQYSEATKKRISQNHADVTGANNPRARKVKCLETDQIFLCQKDALNWCGLKNQNAIRRHLKGQQESAGKHPDTKEKLHWCYVE